MRFVQIMYTWAGKSNFTFFDLVIDIVVVKTLNGISRSPGTHSECAHSDCQIRNISTKSPRLRTPLPVSSFASKSRIEPLTFFCSVAEKLKREGRNEIFEQETMEELEDEEGNVYNRKTYEDLKKQGLI